MAVVVMMSSTQMTLAAGAVPPKALRELLSPCHAVELVLLRRRSRPHEHRGQGQPRPGQQPAADQLGLVGSRGMRPSRLISPSRQRPLQRRGSVSVLQMGRGAFPLSIPAMMRG